MTSKNTAVLQLNALAAQKLKELLESKHQYQKIVFDPSEAFSKIQTQLQANLLPSFKEWVSSLKRQRLAVGTGTVYSVQLEQSLEVEPMLLFQNVKLYCLKCDRREAFVPVWCSDSFAQIRSGRNEAAWSSITPELQLITAVYQCQSCKGEPEAFLIRRKGWELQLHGRSPMEGIEVPKYIPKTEYSLFRDSVIAFNSGKILAALFYLRSFIEQFARRLTGLTGRVTGDTIMDEYNKTLPTQHRASMPSLRECYDSLSIPIHQAKDDVEVFEEQRKAIEKHFEIRKVFDISEASVAAPADKKSPGGPPQQAAS